MSSAKKSINGGPEATKARHYYPLRGWLEGAPKGLADGYEYSYAGTPDEPRVGQSLRGGDFMNIVFDNLNTQRRVALDGLSSVRYLRSDTRDEIVKIMNARLEALAYLAANCLRGMGADQSDNTGTNLMHYPGGPLETDSMGALWHRRPLKDGA